MSYPAPPPPGGSGNPNPYQAPAYGTPGAYPPPGSAPKKDNTLWWILGIIGGVILLCCCGVAGFFIFVANEASEGISSYSSSANSSKNADAAGATPVSEGSSVTVDGAAIQPGWSVLTSTDDISGLSVRNDSGSSNSFFLTFYFMKDGNVIDDVTCNTDFLDAGATDAAPTCVSAIFDIDDHDEIRVGEGF
ncbi:hypothetical protein N5P18_01510 [Janibacter terrae]|uniref:DUF4190 domain-containing protein n=1 Tax=Janibacter terrae TaxID=103817 RepID=A0ABZ2FHF6_9MICO|nr:hypothetical protein [Janibacter terrae]MBA4085216.1 hypothetical protein [Kytococcus sp.]HCE60086.1 hypothetical protein [Janibacter terrae]